MYNIETLIEFIEKCMEKMVQDHNQLYGRLNSLRSSCLYAAPETVNNWIKQTGIVLEEELGPVKEDSGAYHKEIFENWKKFLTAPQGTIK